MIQIKEAKYISDFQIKLLFSDGKEKNVDLKPHLEGPIFEPLKDEAAFKEFYVDPELATIAWKNGADFAPEFLYELN